MAIQIKRAIKALDKGLQKENFSINLYICGSAALVLLGISIRKTGDIDLIAKTIEPALDRAIKRVAKKLNYPENWLNNRVSPIIDRLPSNWEKTSLEVYKGKNLTVYTLSRQNLINSKLHACVERRSLDYVDLLSLSPTKSEIEKAKRYCLKQKSSELTTKDKKDSYKTWVNGFINILIMDLGL